MDAPITEIEQPNILNFIIGPVKNIFSQVACVSQWSGDKNHFVKIFLPLNAVGIQYILEVN